MDVQEAFQATATDHFFNCYYSVTHLFKKHLMHRIAN